MTRKWPARGAGQPSAVASEPIATVAVIARRGSQLLARSLARSLPSLLLFPLPLTTRPASPFLSSLANCALVNRNSESSRAGRADSTKIVHLTSVLTDSS